MAMIFSVWICDTAAYIFGILWGKKKLIERISPKKTIVGFLGGIVGAFVSLYVMNNLGFIQFELNGLHLLTLTFIVGVCGQLGDFVESMFKRDAGVKDSGKLLLRLPTEVHAAIANAAESNKQSINQWAVEQLSKAGQS